MNALLNQLSSFIQWIYDSVSALLDFCTSAIDWLGDMVVVVQTVSNVVCPPALQIVLGLMISFMIIFLVVRLVVNLL